MTGQEEQRERCLPPLVIGERYGGLAVESQVLQQLLLAGGVSLSLARGAARAHEGAGVPKMATLGHGRGSLWNPQAWRAGEAGAETQGRGCVIG